MCTNIRKRTFSCVLLICTNIRKLTFRCVLNVPTNNKILGFLCLLDVCNRTTILTLRCVLSMGTQTHHQQGSRQTQHHYKRHNQDNVLATLPITNTHATFRSGSAGCLTLTTCSGSSRSVMRVVESLHR